MQFRQRTPIWLWPHLLSLDAPIVALVWQDFVVRCYPSILLPAGRCVLGLTVWAIYLGDRLLDVRTEDGARNESPSHAFYRKNRRPLAMVLLAVLLADVFVAIAWLRPAVRWNGLALGAAVIAYLLMFGYWRLGEMIWKRLAAASLFSAGVFLVGLTENPHWTILVCPFFGLSALCLCNLLVIVRQESKDKRSSSWLWIAAATVACLLPGNRSWNLALMTSIAGLIGVDLSGNLASPRVGRVLVDLALLSPLLYP